METKKNILKHLARIADKDQIAKKAIEKEADKIAQILSDETQYEVITEQIELLDTIAYRVFEKAVATCSALLKRLETIQFTYQDIAGFPIEKIKKLYTKEKVIISALGVLQHIRYHAPEAITDLFFEYSVYPDEAVRKQANDSIKLFSKYDLDIFYGDDDGWAGLGWGPQEKVLEKIKSFTSEQQKRYLDAILVASRMMLSPTIEGTKWSYDQVTISTGAIPADEGIKSLRSQTLDILKSLYIQAETPEIKVRIFGVMQVAAGIPHKGKYGEEMLEMVSGNIVTILEFLKEIVLSEDMLMMQRIEHDTYWYYYRMGKINPQIKKIAFEIREMLLAHKEFKIFRVLIGFESIFQDWKTDETSGDTIKQERLYREEKSVEFAQSITEDNYEDWKKRILNYASIKSNDLAMFPYFGKFLEAFGKHAPELALKFVQDNVEELNGFVVAILCGAALTDKEKVYKVIQPWVNNGIHLFYVLRFFEFSDDLDENMFKLIFDSACKQNDFSALNQVIATLSAKISNERKPLIGAYFIPAVRLLNKEGNYSWIYNFWYRTERQEVIDAIPDDGIQIILENLFLLPSIEHQAEEILYQLAERAPEQVIEFFIRRLDKEKSTDPNSQFEAIPFNFYKLAEPLSKVPKFAVNALRKGYDGNYGMFIYRGARLLKNIFPQFHKDLEKSLIEVLHKDTKDDILFVMAILRNYEGEPFLHGVCRELVNSIPEDDMLKAEIKIILESTGVVNGRDGFVEAFERKIGEIQYWLEDTNIKIRSFAEHYIQMLKERIEAENKRIEEDTILRKHQYGDDAD